MTVIPKKLSYNVIAIYVIVCQFGLRFPPVDVAFAKLL